MTLLEFFGGVEIITKTKNKNKNNSIKESKDEIPEKKGKENIYNKTMNSLAQNYPPLTANNINKKMESSSENIMSNIPTPESGQNIGIQRR